MREEWRWFTVQQLQDDGILLVEDGNHGEYRPRASEFVEDGVAKFVRATDMTDGRILFDAANSISDVALARIRKGIGQPGDILFSHKGTVGKLAVAPNDAEPFVCSPQTTFWRVLQPLVLNPGFLYTFMRSPLFVRQWHVRKGETDMADYVSLTAQRRLKVPVPEYREQRQLAAATSALDRSIENNRRRIEMLEEMARLVYREWFVHFRFPGHEGVELVDSLLGPIPEGWTTATLSDIASYINRGVAPTYDEDSPSLVINQRCVRDHRASLDLARRHITKVSKDKLVRMGDVLINSTGVGTLGRVAPVRVDLHDTTVDSHVTIVRPHAEINVDYFAELVLSLEPLFESMGVGSTGQTELSRARVGEVSVVVAPKLVRDSFGDFASPMSALVANLIVQKEVLARARDLLLPRLISGQLDVSDLDLGLEPVA